MQTGKLALASYLDTFGAMESTECSCGRGRQDVRHILLHCTNKAAPRARHLTQGSRRELDYRFYLTRPDLAPKAVRFMLQTGLLGQFRAIVATYCTNTSVVSNIWSNISPYATSKAVACRWIKLAGKDWFWMTRLSYFATSDNRNGLCLSTIWITRQKSVFARKGKLMPHGPSARDQEQEFPGSLGDLWFWGGVSCASMDISCSHAPLSDLVYLVNYVV